MPGRRRTAVCHLSAQILGAAQQALSDIRNCRLGRILLVNIVDNQYRLPTYYQKDAWRGHQVH